MAITYTPFDELFASAYQLTYISTDGHIDVGPNTYSVFHNYTMTERQQIFQVCKKHLPWEQTQEQEQWERTMYMYQFIIKSPAPFPYEEYPLSEDIIMAITWELKITPINISTYEASIVAIRIDNTDLENIDIKTYMISRAKIQTSAQQLAVGQEIRAKHLAALAATAAVEAFTADAEAAGKQYLEGLE